MKDLMDGRIQELGIGKVLANEDLGIPRLRPIALPVGVPADLAALHKANQPPLIPNPNGKVFKIVPARSGHRN